MAFTLDNLRSGTKQARIMVNGKPFKFDVDPNALNNDLMDDYREASEDRDYQTMADVMSQVITSWDLTESDEEGAPEVPITADILRTLPLAFLNKIWDEIAGVVAPKSRKKSGN